MQVSEQDPARYVEEEYEMEKKAQLGVNVEYKSLIAISLTRRKHDMDVDLKVDLDKVSRMSLGETAYEKATTTHGAEIIKWDKFKFFFLWTYFFSAPLIPFNLIMGNIY